MTWAALDLSTDVPDAARAYRLGVTELVAGIPGARSHLAAALELDPAFFLAAVAVCVVESLATGVARRVPRAPAAANRGERHHAEVVAAVLAGDHARWIDLRRQHLLEFPTDILVVWLPAAWSPVGR